MNYIAKPWHLLFSCVLALGGAAVMTFPGYGVAGVLITFLGFVSGVWIFVAGLWAERARYLDSLSGAIESATKLDYDKLLAMGISDVDAPAKVHVDLHSGSRSQHFYIPISFEKMRVVAGALLDGQSFTERRWSGAGALMSASEFRSLRATLLKHDLIQPVSEKANQQGFMLTDAGVQFMREWVSPSPSSDDD